MNNNLAVTGRTRVCGIFGFPVEHSLSPAMHNAAFSELGLDYVYVPFPVNPANLSEAVASIRALNIAGVNVTVPHKERVIPFLDEISGSASLIGAVNTIVNRNGRLLGYNTDGAGFLRSLEQDADFNPGGKTVLILGAGGAARAVSVEIALSGAGTLLIANRTVEKALSLVNHINGATPCPSRFVPWNADAGIKEALDEADLIINTTSLGMYPETEGYPPLDYSSITETKVVYDLIYNPARTAFLTRAAERGARTVNGMGMLLHQGAIAFELWTGHQAPLEFMQQILMDHLGKG